MENELSNTAPGDGGSVPAPPPARRPRRRWFQFSLRTLLVVTTLVAVWLGMTVQRAERQRRGADVARKVDGTVEYQSRMVRFDDGTLPPEPGPAWLRKLIGVDYFDDVALISISATARPPISDADLATIAGCEHLTHLFIPGANITDKGLQHVSQLRELTHVILSQTKISDAGLVHLAGLKHLKSLQLSETQITDDGLIPIAELPALEWLELARTRVSNVGVAQLAKLRNLRSLDLAHTHVTDDALLSLAKSTTLEDLNLEQTHVTAAAIDKLMRSNPNLAVSDVGGNILPRVVNEEVLD